MKLPLLGTPTWGDMYWTVFLSIVFVAFMGPEIYALDTNKANTLSDWIWAHVKPGTAAWYLSLGMYLVVTSWLVWHFWFQEFR